MTGVVLDRFGPGESKILVFSPPLLQFFSHVQVQLGDAASLDGRGLKTELAPIYLLLFYLLFYLKIRLNRCSLEVMEGGASDAGVMLAG